MASGLVRVELEAEAGTDRSDRALVQLARLPAKQSSAWSVERPAPGQVRLVADNSTVDVELEPVRVVFYGADGRRLLAQDPGPTDVTDRLAAPTFGLSCADGRVAACHDTFVERRFAAVEHVQCFAVCRILWTLLTSLKANADIVTADIQYIPLHPTFENYATLWAQAGFPTVFFNSAVTESRADVDQRTGVVPPHRRLTRGEPGHDLLKAVVGDARWNRVVFGEQLTVPSFGSPIVDDKGQPAMDRQKATDAVR